VSLVLGHQSVVTTERYYADFSKGYMDKVEAGCEQYGTAGCPKLRRRCKCTMRVVEIRQSRRKYGY
jgi:hypothetical protein